MINKMVKDIKDNGFTRIENFITPENAIHIEEFIHKFNINNYTKENLFNRICFKREEGKNRQGDAYMVSLDENPLGSIIIDDSVVQSILEIYHSVLEKFTGKKIKHNSRSMLNCQQYFENSFQVVDHYDGLFLDFEHGEQNLYGEKPLIVGRALLPRLVAVIVLRNENEKGTYIRYHDSTERIDIPNKSYDLIIFDNIKMRHGVPPLEKPRMMIGFRNFDHCPYIFHKSVEDERGWIKLEDTINPGYCLELSPEESENIQKEFNRVWKTGLCETQLSKPAAF